MRKDVGVPGVASTSESDNQRFSAVQIAAVFLSIVFVDAGYQASLGQPAAHPVLAWLSIASYALGFGALVLALRRDSKEGGRSTLEGWTALGFVLAFAVQIAIYVTTQETPSRYGTDALAFNHYSAQVLLNGHDPYTASMEPAYRAFDVPAAVYTPTVNGGLVLSQSYPALSFLIYVPFVFLHLRSMLFVELGFAMVSMILLSCIAAPGRKALAMLVFFASAEYLNFAAGSVTDVIWLPLMIVAAAFWNSKSLIAPIALGLACATKQEPWFVVPFALVYWFRMREQVPALRNVAAAFLAFVVPNLPFILWHPSAWLRGIFFPMFSGAVPLGSGIVQLATSNVLSFPVEWLSVLWPGVLFAGVAIYAVRYRSLGWMPFVWPAVTLFFSPRSLENYFLYWPIVATAYLVSPNRNAQNLAPERRLPKLPAITFAASSACVLAGAVLLTTAFFRPLHDMRILGAQFDPLTGLVRTVRLEIESPGAEALKFRFAVDSSARGAVFWRVAHSTNADSHRAHLDLEAPDIAEEVPVSPIVGIQVAAYTRKGGAAGYTSSWMPEGPIRPSLAGVHLICAKSRFGALPQPAPLSWTYSASDFFGGAISCLSNGRRDGILTFRLPRPPRNVWRVGAIYQFVDPGNGTLSFWSKPAADSTASVFPTHLFGVSIIDGLNQQFYVVTNSKLRKPKFLIRDSFRYYIVPGRLHEWNHIRVAIRNLPGFYTPPYEPVQLMVMDAIHGGNSQSITSDAFGGFGQSP